jgi:hypothetical protein
MQITKFQILPNSSTRGRRARSERSKIFIFPEGETVLQNLANRRHRPSTAYKKEVIPQILEKAGLPADTKVSWSQKAGCSCGCSPGFLLPDSCWGFKVYVTVSE